MRKEREALLIATLAGLVIVGAAAFAVQPSLGDKPTPATVHLSAGGIADATSAVVTNAA